MSSLSPSRTYNDASPEKQAAEADNGQKETKEAVVLEHPLRHVTYSAFSLARGVVVVSEVWSVFAKEKISPSTQWNLKPYNVACMSII